MGVVDYNPASKRFLVKRVLVPDKLLEKKKEKEEVTVQGSGVEEAAEAPTEERGSSPKESEAVSLHVCLCVFTMMFHCVVLHDLPPTLLLSGVTWHSFHLLQSGSNSHLDGPDRDSTSPVGGSDSEGRGSGSGTYVCMYAC